MTLTLFKWYGILRHYHHWTVLQSFRWALWLQKSRRTRAGALYLAIALAIGSLGMSGCDGEDGFALSLQPSYTPVDLELDQALAGAWATTEGDVTFSFEQGERMEYKVVVKERDGEKETSAEFEAHLMRIGAFWFLDFLPNGAPGGSEFYQMHLFRAHSIARVEISQDALRMAFFDATWLQKKIDEKSLDISYQKTDGMLLLTGTTEEVQDLLFRHGSDDGAFPEPITMARQGMEQ